MFALYWTRFREIPGSDCFHYSSDNDRIVSLALSEERERNFCPWGQRREGPRVPTTVWTDERTRNEN